MHLPVNKSLDWIRLFEWLLEVFHLYAEQERKDLITKDIKFEFMNFLLETKFTHLFYQLHVVEVKYFMKRH